MRVTIMVRPIKDFSVMFKQQTLCVFASKLKKICTRIRQKVFNTISTSACTSDKINKRPIPSLSHLPFGDEWERVCACYHNGKAN